MQLDPRNGMSIALPVVRAQMRAELEAVRANIAAECDALRRELGEVRAKLYRLETLVAADQAEPVRQRMIAEASCAVRDPELPLQ